MPACSAIILLAPCCAILGGIRKCCILYWCIQVFSQGWSFLFRTFSKEAKIRKEFVKNLLIPKKDFVVIHNEWLTAGKEKKTRMGNFAKVCHPSPSGRSAKIVAMLFCLKDSPGREPEVGQQEQTHPFEWIFSKISHHSIYYIVNIVLLKILFSFHISAPLLMLAVGDCSAFYSQSCVFQWVFLPPLLQQNTRRLALKLQLGGSWVVGGFFSSGQRFLHPH